jgi:hypothetical protein
VSKVQLARWVRAGLIPRIEVRRGRGFGRGWEAVRYPSEAKSRVMALARARNPARGIRPQRLTLDQMAWVLWLEGFPPDFVRIRAALERALTMHRREFARVERERERARRDVTGEVIDPIASAASRALATGLLRKIRRRLNPRDGRQPQRFADFLDMLFALLTGADVGFAPADVQHVFETALGLDAARRTPTQFEWLYGDTYDAIASVTAEMAPDDLRRLLRAASDTDLARALHAARELDRFASALRFLTRELSPANRLGLDLLADLERLPTVPLSVQMLRVLGLLAFLEMPGVAMLWDRWMAAHTDGIEGAERTQAWLRDNPAQETAHRAIVREGIARLGFALDPLPVPPTRETEPL